MALLDSGLLDGNLAAGGGIFLRKSEFNMKDGVISSNIAEGSSGGGGVLIMVRGFTITGGQISGNIAEQAPPDFSDIVGIVDSQ